LEHAVCGNGVQEQDEVTSRKLPEHKMYCTTMQRGKRIASETTLPHPQRYHSTANGDPWRCAIPSRPKQSERQCCVL